MYPPSVDLFSLIKVTGSSPSDEFFKTGVLLICSKLSNFIINHTFANLFIRTPLRDGVSCFFLSILINGLVHISIARETVLFLEVCCNFLLDFIITIS